MIASAVAHRGDGRSARRGRRALATAKVTDVTELRVPGTFELTVAAARLAGAGFDAIVALGVVIRGGTPHFDYVCQAATWA